MQVEFSKRMRGKLSPLAGIAYERELGAQLEKLATTFDRWRGGELDAFSADDAIHKYATSAERRSLFGWYTTKSLLPLMVAQAIVRGILRPHEVDEDVKVVLADAIEFYERGLADGTVSFAEED